MNQLALLLLCVFYGAYLVKMAAQRRQGISTNVMIKGIKSRRAYLLGILLTITTYLACTIQFLSCFFAAYMGAISVAPALRGLGLLCIALGNGFFITAFMTLKDSWRAGIDESQKTDLITHGIYRYSRNPAFAGFDLTYIGCCLAVSNICILVMACLAMCMMHLQILEEEKHLAKIFGPAYQDYRKRVRRYL